MIDADLEKALDVEISIERKEKRDALAEKILVALVAREDFSMYSGAHRAIEIANAFYEVLQDLDSQV